MMDVEFGLIDLIVCIFWIFFILSIGFVVKIVNKDKVHYKYFFPALLFKMLFALVFAVTYVVILYGGDTVAYWDGAVKLHRLFWDNPGNFFMEIWIRPSSDTMTMHFNSNTGYPPGWIYRGASSFFVSKLMTPLTFITGNSYWGMTIVCSAIAFYSSWKFFEFLKDIIPCKPWIIVIATLFIPTVAFWASGVAKDTVILVSTQYCIILLFSFIYKKDAINFKNILLLLFYAFILYRVRSFMLVAILAPYSLIVGLRIIKLIARDKYFQIFLKGVTIIFSGLIVVGYLAFNSEIIEENAFLQTAAIKQADFAANVTYTGPRYDLGVTDYSPVGLIKASPKSIMTAFYRPFIWEASSAFLLLSALEGVCLILLTVGFFFRSGNIFKHFSFISNTEILLFAIVFTLILGFFVGFTSGLFNVLVRFKAPLMTLLVLFFASKQKYLKPLQE